MAFRVWHDLLGLFYPRLCCGCDTPLMQGEDYLCLHCHSELPYTHFEKETGNPMERVFAGRANIRWGAALLYFSKDTRVQHIIHHIKYKRRDDLARWMGQQMGQRLQESGKAADLLIPVPLHPDKEKRRGYNQSAELARGMAEAMGIPLDTATLTREVFTATQTRKRSRIDRWDNVETAFSVVHTDAVAGRHILLVDDVVTTGSTLEACVRPLQEAGCASVAISTLGFATHF